MPIATGRSLTRFPLIAALVCSSVLTLPGHIRAQEPTDIEKNFTHFNSTDLSGNYQAKGVLGDSTPYDVTVTLSKWNTFKTLQGNILQVFKLNYEWAGLKYNGIAVFDGHRLYYASSDGDDDNFSLSLLGKLVLSPQRRNELAGFLELKSESFGTKKYAKWKDKSPWYGYFRLEDDVFGYKLPMTGKITEFTSHGHGWPPKPDTGRYRVLILEKNGEHDDKNYERTGLTFNEAGGFVVETLGQNLTLSFVSYDSWKNGFKLDYWGTGMLVPGKDPTDSIIVAMTGGSDYTQFGLMDVSENKFVGFWTWVGGDSRRTEVWEPSEEVALKNPHLFKH